LGYLSISPYRVKPELRAKLDQKRYEELEVKAENCMKCTEYEPKCPYKILNISILQKVHKEIQR